jgi:hypothetical protein
MGQAVPYTFSRARRVSRLFTRILIELSRTEKRAGGASATAETAKPAVSIAPQLRETANLTAKMPPQACETVNPHETMAPQLRETANLTAKMPPQTREPVNPHETIAPQLRETANLTAKIPPQTCEPVNQHEITAARLREAAILPGITVSQLHEDSPSTLSAASGRMPQTPLTLS